MNHIEPPKPYKVMQVKGGATPQWRIATAGPEPEWRRRYEDEVFVYEVCDRLNSIFAAGWTAREKAGEVEP